jgi:hypothetical protein
MDIMVTWLLACCYCEGEGGEDRNIIGNLGVRIFFGKVNCQVMRKDESLILHVICQLCEFQKVKSSMMKLDILYKVILVPVGYGFRWVDLIQPKPTSSTQCQPVQKTRATRLDPPASERM